MQERDLRTIGKIESRKGLWMAVRAARMLGYDADTYEDCILIRGEDGSHTIVCDGQIVETKTAEEIVQEQARRKEILERYRYHFVPCQPY